MKLKQGDMWSAYPDSDLFLVTTNSTVRKDGALVMGRGIALEAKTRFPDLPFAAGAWLRAAGLTGGDYGILLPYPNMDHPQHRVGMFQVKRHWGDQASLDLIRLSVTTLSQLVEEDGYENVHLNFPGIGNGKLQYAHVLPLLSELPPQVTVWTR